MSVAELLSRLGVIGAFCSVFNVVEGAGASVVHVAYGALNSMVSALFHF